MIQQVVVLSELSKYLDCLCRSPWIEEGLPASIEIFHQSTGEGTVGGPVSQEPCFAPARTPNEFISTCQTYVAGEKHD